MSSFTKLSLRALLGADHGPKVEEDDHDDELGHDDEPGPSTLDLRIAAAFCILFAGLAGSFPPLYFKVFKDQAHPATRVLRAFSGGVILALALVHIIPEGLYEMDTLDDYPYGGPTIVFGIIVMVLMENMSQVFMARKHLHSHGHSHAHAHDSRAHEELEHKGMEESLPLEEEKEAKKDAGSDDMPPAPVKPAQDASVISIAVDDHSHSCLSTNNTANWLSSTADPMAETSIRAQVAAYMFEFGCVAHSFIIGLSLGVTVDGRSQVVALLIALSFHQGLEGLGLGSVVTQAGFSRLKGILMVVAYSLTAPAGVAIGIVVANTYNAETNVAIAVQGTLNCISGGMLLYVSLIQLIAEDFSREDLTNPTSISVKLCTYAALVFGAFCMCLLAEWA
eukprot:gene27974-8859_t